MKTLLEFDAGMFDDRAATDPAAAPLLEALRARGVRIGILAAEAPGVVARPVAPDGSDVPPRIDPPRTCVVTHDVDSIRRAKDSRFGFVAGIASTTEAKRAKREAGADLVVPSVADLTVDDIDAWFANREHARPSIPSHRAALAGRLTGRTPILFLDYDGTLTPIVARPELAVLAPEMRRTLIKLAAQAPVIIVSGRGREDVARLVGIDELIYAGSHGLDIAGPSDAGSPIRHQVAAELHPVMRQVTADLTTALASIPGVLVEDKRFAVTVHYRQVAADRIAEIEAAVERAGASCPDLKVTRGKKVLELRPAVEWDKGQAVLWLLRALDLDGEEAVPIYLGDDTTDEDAFGVLHDRGLTALVARTPRPTAAGYSLQDIEEVGDFLRSIILPGPRPGALA
jgi:trehalose-phosphatase